MKNYKALKGKSKVAVKKAKVVDRAAVSEVKDDDGNVVRSAEAEQSHDELQLVQKRYDPNSGKALDDSVQSISLSSLASDISRVKDEISKLQDEQADMEQLEKDLKAL